MHSCKSRNEEHKAMFLVVSRPDMYFGFGLPFFTCPISCASKIARPKNRVCRIKFSHPCYIFDLSFTEDCIRRENIKLSVNLAH